MPAKWSCKSVMKSLIANEPVVLSLGLKLWRASNLFVCILMLCNQWILLSEGIFIIMVTYSFFITYKTKMIHLLHIMNQTIGYIFSSILYHVHSLGITILFHLYSFHEQNWRMHFFSHSLSLPFPKNHHSIPSLFHFINQRSDECVRIKH